MPSKIPRDRFHDLVEAATTVFLEAGYRRTQMADVARRMGIAKGTIYLYVESKEALFQAVLRHADSGESIDLPADLPVPTPAPGAILEEVRKRVEAHGFPILIAAVRRRRVVDARAELEAIVRELYGVLYRNRVGIKLLDRCSPDHPELAAIWYGAGREGVLGLLRTYLEERVRRRRLVAVSDPAITARIVLETAVFWAVHSHWDPSPQAIEEHLVEEAVVNFVVRALFDSDSTDEA